MDFLVIGTNHKYSSTEFRERLSFSKRKREQALFFLREGDVLSGVVILSTCNRTEVYASTEDARGGIRRIMNLMSRYHGGKKGPLFSRFYAYEGRDAVRHLCNVCAGLDSMIIGETQILRQVSDSFSAAEDAGAIDPYLKYIFRTALSVAKEVHVKTAVSEGKVSIGSVAVDFVKQKAGTVAGKNVLIIGVGKVAELVLKYLKEEKASVFFISNRTYDKAKILADSIGGEVVRFGDLKNAIRRADIVISATASPHFVLKKNMLEDIGGPLLIVDLAVPRDVDPAVRGFENVELYDLEDLNGVIQNNMERKGEEAKRAKKIVDIEVEKLWKDSLKLGPEPVLSH
jgi:glutamyl-tRNA reductase